MIKWQCYCARSFGTPFVYIRYLKSRLFIFLDYQGDISIFEQFIESGLPILVNVMPLEWPHWQGEVTYHTVLVIGIDRNNDTIYIHDPFLPKHLSPRR